ncbi:LAME_0F11914g1_1 [Lachancea meyersii CBS 8951]|uniref:LAME_0F11914g1_1 n=1 Tax=Lachancea meyersii CBS 8951 TaxID=1266667 RepID=A0A1G4JWC0_9SACH|nr:LAME_0F11914g1_1 [Lachancea meyersii CBS 8951]
MKFWCSTWKSVGHCVYEQTLLPVQNVYHCICKNAVVVGTSTCASAFFTTYSSSCLLLVTSRYRLLVILTYSESKSLEASSSVPHHSTRLDEKISFSQLLAVTTISTICIELFGVVIELSAPQKKGPPNAFVSYRLVPTVVVLSSFTILIN